jgi:hypothetical protein
MATQFMSSVVQVIEREPQSALAARPTASNSLVRRRL